MNGPARVVNRSESDGRLEPLYPPSRIITRDAAAAEEEVRTALTEARRGRAEAERVVADAREQAAALVAAAREEADVLRAAAREGAHAEASKDLHALLRALDTRFEELREGIAEEVQRAAFHFARAVLDVEFEVTPERIVELVRGALHGAARYERVQVIVHPTTVEFLEAARAALSADLACDLVVTADREIEPTGARIETEMGTFWAGVADQLRPLREHLRLPPEENTL